MSENPTQPKKTKRVLPKALKIGAAVVVLIGMLFSMGTVWVKDSRNNPEYCALCHEEPYYEGWADSDSIQLVHTHAESGVSCQRCHDRTVKESLGEWQAYLVGYEVPLRERKLPMEESCFGCHDSYAKMIPLTTPEILGSERNPHEGHWGELECGNCHNMHRDSVDYCAGCHNPVTDAPGWIIDGTTS